MRLKTQNAPKIRGIFYENKLMMETKEHEKFLRMAIKLSEKNVLESLGGPFGAVVVKDGKVIGKSANKVTTTNDPTAHAEVSAIRLACRKLNNFDLTGCIIYTSCEPCPMCLAAIYWARIDAVYYSNTKQDAANIKFDDSFIYEEIKRPIDQRRLPIKQLLRNEALQAFKLWDQSAMKTSY